MHATGRCPLILCLSKEFRRAVSPSAASFSQLFCRLALSCVLLTPASSFGQAASSNGLPPGDQNFECNAEPSQVKPGQLVKITVKPLGSDFLYAFGSSAGTLTVTGNSALLNTVGMKDSVTVICSAVDQSGRTVQATVTVSSEASTLPPPQPPPVPANMTVKEVSFDTTPPPEAYTFGATIAPSLSWTTGTQTQTIAGGSMLISEARTTTYCDPKMIQFGLAANASDTSTTKLTGPTTNLDNNDLKLNATKVAYAPADRATPNTHFARGYISADAEFFGNNSLGIGLQQAYTADFQFYLRECKDTSELEGEDGAKKAESKPRFFASLGIGAGYMDQRLYATANKLNAAILPVTA